jgi:hypothetical protein
VLDDHNERVVSLGTYEHDLIAIRLFYMWADGEYGVGNRSGCAGAGADVGMLHRPSVRRRRRRRCGTGT